MAEVNIEAYKEEIRRSFALVKPIATEAAAIFYPTLWEVDPSTKILFKNTDMDTQGVKLMKTLGVAVATLDKMDALIPILQNLGRKHVTYGVKAYMYPSVGKALLLTLEKGLGEECTSATKEAWTWVLGVISGVCIAAAKEVHPTYGEEDSPEVAKNATEESKLPDPPAMVPEVTEEPQVVPTVEAEKVEVLKDAAVEEVREAVEKAELSKKLHVEDGERAEEAAAETTKEIAEAARPEAADSDAVKSESAELSV